MKYLLIALTFLFVSCTTTQPTMNPIAAVGCDVETALTTPLAASVAAVFSCTNQSAIQASFQTALGNANFCAQPGVAGTTTAQIEAAKTAIKDGVNKGIIGSVICPLAINTLVGLATPSIPASWGCSASASSSTLLQALTVACVAVVPL